MNTPTPTIGTTGHEGPPSQSQQRLLRSAVNAWEHRRKQTVPFVQCSDGLFRKPQDIRWLIVR